MVSKTSEAQSETLIHLQTFSPNEAFPSFCVLEDDGRSPGDHLFSLSPGLMRWSEHEWIIDLRPCRHFWERQRVQEGLGFYALFERVISEVFQGKHYCCIFAEHPWPALVFLQVLKEKKARGIYALDSLFNQKCYARVAWLSWFAPLEQLSHHLIQLKIPGFRPTAFRVKQARMKRFVDRMGLAGPFDLKQAEASAIARRFSGWLGKVWQWTFQDSETETREQLQEQGSLFSAFENIDALQSFPWRPFELTPPPAVKRHLDDPINDWSILEPLLQEDLHRLCLSQDWTCPPARVSELTWTLTLYHLKTLHIPLRFRHPYDLHGDEKSGFKTALSQAHFSYLDVLEGLRRREVDLDLPEQIPLIAWSMVVSGQIVPDPQPLSLIPNPGEDPEIERIRNLQNKLSRPIINYGISPDFDPAQAFYKKDIGSEFQHSDVLDPWIAASQKRPLFFYPKPKNITVPSRSKARFLERTAASWWENKDIDAATKDYFLLEDEGGQPIWAYKDNTGVWYQHGIYS